MSIGLKLLLQICFDTLILLCGLVCVDTGLNQPAGFDSSGHCTKTIPLTHLTHTNLTLIWTTTTLQLNLTLEQIHTKW